MSSATPVTRHVHFKDCIHEEREHEGPSLSLETKFLNILGLFLQNSAINHPDFYSLAYPVVTLVSGRNYMDHSNLYVNSACPDRYGSAASIRKALHQLWDSVEGTPISQRPSPKEALRRIAYSLRLIWLEEEQAFDEDKDLDSFPSEVSIEFPSRNIDLQGTLSSLLVFALGDPMVKTAFKIYWADYNQQYSPPPIQTKLNAPLRSILKKESPRKELSHTKASDWAQRLINENETWLSYYNSHQLRFQKLMYQEYAYIASLPKGEDADWSTLNWILEQPSYRKIDATTVEAPKDPPEHSSSPEVAAAAAKEPS